MSVKARRQEVIRRVIAGSSVVSQEALVAELLARGEDVTQATVSRDLRELGVLKGPEGYRLPGPSAAQAAPRDTSELARAVRDFLLEAEAAGTIVVLRTGAGQASALALRIDRAGWRDIVGTVAGDDTVFAATRSAAEARRVVEVFERMKRGVTE
ncbi:MAG: arginine repressor [Tepidisphaera sp.]|jgi:transcriptional regulator of arginine metabolism